MASMTISSNQFSYDVSTPFGAQVMLTNSSWRYPVMLSVFNSLNGQGRYVIMYVNVTHTQPFVSRLYLNATYNLELKLVRNNQHVHVP